MLEFEGAGQTLALSLGLAPPLLPSWQLLRVLMLQGDPPEGVGQPLALSLGLAPPLSPSRVLLLLFPSWLLRVLLLLHLQGWTWLVWRVGWRWWGRWLQGFF